MDDQIIQRMSQFLTTEHFTLQGARNGTISEANGRLGAFLSTVASGIVALAFVAQIAGLGKTFLYFAFLIFPILIILGLTTFLRLAELGVTDVLLLQAIHRIRHYYLEMTPQAERFFSFPQHDDPEAIRSVVTPLRSRFEGLTSAPAQVVMINSFLAGVFASILSTGLLFLSVPTAILIGLVVLALSIAGHGRWSAGVQRRIQRRWEIRFPPPAVGDDG